MIQEENSPQSFAGVVDGPSAQLHNDTTTGEGGLHFMHWREMKAPLPRWGAQAGVGKEEEAPLLSLRTTPCGPGLISRCSKGGFPSMPPFPRGMRGQSHC